MQKSNYGDDEKLPKSIDLSHHLSDLAKARGVSPLKGLFRYLGRPGMVALAGGEPKLSTPLDKNTQ
jgi:aromatic amino acid aminotransferase I / 2-aminoadipate transaminase